MADLKTRLIQLLDLSRSFQQQLIADLDPAERNASGTWENWSIKDELAHVIAWQLNSLARIAALIHAEPMPDFSDYEAINRAVYNTNHDRSSGRYCRRRRSGACRIRAADRVTVRR